ncbi:MAG: hypothetical protein K2O16_09545 [Lachnospiraceae bacterium]|nr:hypothetical protein [Lachnospiraceae bacterium]
MKNKKLIVGVMLTVISVIIMLMMVIVRPISVEQEKSKIDTNVDLLLINEPLKDKVVMNKAVSENSIGMNNELPNYYHSVSDADESFVYLGGAGGIYRIASGIEVKKLYSAPMIAGAALHGGYIFSLEYNTSDEGMTVELIKINKESFDKEILTRVSSASYDLRVFDNTLIISEAVLGEYGIETAYQAYTINDEGNLMSDISEDVCGQFELSEGYEEDMQFLINPWFSMKYFGYSCFTKVTGEMSINSVWIKKEDQALAEEIVTCSGEPLLTRENIFYCSSDEKKLVQLVFDNSQEITLYEIPEGKQLSLLTYDADWVYILQMSDTDESGSPSCVIMRVNVQDHRIEEVFQSNTGDSISNFNVYGDDCYFILSSADNSRHWECYNLTNSTMTAIR